MRIPFGPETEVETKANFLWGRKLGYGSYAKVLVAKRVDSTSATRWAVKIVDKKLLFKHNMQRQLLVEYEVFRRLKGIPAFVDLDFTFQDEEFVYFGLELVPNGDLGSFLAKVGKCDLALARVYAAELITACEAMHSRNILHRDLKPENILLTADWHLKVTDFGTCRVMDQQALLSPQAKSGSIFRKKKSRTSMELPRRSADETKMSGEFCLHESAKQLDSPHTTELLTPPSKPPLLLDLNEVTSDGEDVETDSESEDEDCLDTPRLRKETFVGSAYYVSPEMLKKEGVGCQADLWAVGCMLYKMLVGTPPFKGAHQALTFKLIQERNIFWPADIDPQAKDFIDKVLQIDPQRRLGGKGNAVGYQEIRAHPFFHGLHWESLLSSRVPMVDLPPSTVPARSVSAYGTLPRSPSRVPVATPSRGSSVWDAFLDPGEVLVFAGPVDKSNPRNPIPTKRVLLLTNKPRLFYVDASANKIKGNIPWTGMAAEVRGPRVLYLHTPKRRYKLTTHSSSAASWREEIQKVQAAEITGTLQTLKAAEELDSSE